jgi:hypothetical protein
MSKYIRPKLNEETDAILSKKAESTWVTVDDFSIYIKRTEEGVAVDIYAREFEDCNALSSCYALHDDVEEMREEEDLEVD